MACGPDPACSGSLSSLQLVSQSCLAQAPSSHGTPCCPLGTQWGQRALQLYCHFRQMPGGSFWKLLPVAQAPQYQQGPAHTALTPCALRLFWACPPKLNSGSAGQKLLFSVGGRQPHPLPLLAVHCCGYPECMLGSLCLCCCHLQAASWSSKHGW